MTTHTPWGRPDSSKEIAPGITRYDTPSHGGYYVSPERVLTGGAVYGKPCVQWVIEVE